MTVTLEAVTWKNLEIGSHKAARGGALRIKVHALQGTPPKILPPRNLGVLWTFSRDRDLELQ
jgi:hypothetical protein